MLKIKELFSMFGQGFKNASYLGMGTLAGQVIGFIGFLFIARMLGKEQYGIFVIVMNFVFFFHIFTLPGLQKVIVREGSKDTDGFSKVLDHTIGLRLIFICIAMALCVGVSFFTAYSPLVKTLIIIMSAEIIYFGLDSFFSAIYQTAQRMQYIALFQLYLRILVTGLSIGILLLGGTVTVILIVNLFSRFLVLFLNYFRTRKFFKFKLNFRFRADSALIKATFVFSVMNFINAFVIRIDVLMVSFLTNEESVGIYGVAHELGREGILLRNILATAFFPLAIKFFTKNQIKVRTIFLYSLILFGIVSLGSLLIFFFSEDLVVLLFMEDFRLSGQILKALVFYLPFAFFILPFSTSLQATHNEKLLIPIYGMSALLNIPLNLILFDIYGLVGIAYSTIIVYFLQSVVLMFVATKFLKRRGHFA
ncbi:oligosaccharide flippase family protein [Acidobacteriota bacterium]